ncbi:MAG: HD domain-containing protein [Clostridia bacterium]|nr:HD domain-containing protein [Clostridia bacterium]MBR0028022.1 HD domain-containing protein [Clostridia bacterium]MBR0470456.1 HD domain-containing protein [Clostridia bacterium]
MNSVLYCMEKLNKNSKLRQMDDYIQHGSTSCLKHTIAVAYYSIKLADRLGIKYKKSELIRGALLHDYFLYDWHDGNGRGVHGFTHPSAALKNADRDFTLTETERNIIKRHMFPLTPIPPKCREAWIVCMVDKYCSLYETFNRKTAYEKVQTKTPDKFTELYKEIINF